MGLLYTSPPINGIQTSTVIAAHDQLGAHNNAGGNPATAAYPLANLALYVPFSVSETVTAYEGWVVTGITAGNFDIGIYDAAGARLTSSGATAKVVSDVTNTTAMTNQVLTPGVYYYMAFASDGTTNFFSTAPAAGLCESWGILESTTSYVLPASPTLSRTTRAYIPHFGLNLYTVAL
jgi:hypothetical protein